MSDFDREAEREKLREKYERDKQKREASERMSELLLQGATMTNRHCPECHSPVFRYEGREFCPTCQKEVTEDGELVEPEGEPAPEADDADAETADPEPNEAPPDDEPPAESDPDDGAVSERSAEAADSASHGSGDTAEEAETGEPAEPETGSPPAPSRERRPARVDPPVRRDDERDDDRRRLGDDARAERPESERDRLRDAEATLVSEVETLTRRAAETRDVGRKRDLLAAAREAAETLETVRRL